jgi:predicted phage terminase large subunit-like protein
MPISNSGEADERAVLSEQERSALSLHDWAEKALAPSGFRPAAHHRLLLTELEAIAEGQSDRLMILMPPGSAKSTYASVVFPVWWFLRHPASSIIAASHTSDLAGFFGRQVRNLIAENSKQLGYDVAPDTRGANRWLTTRRGSYFAVGVRGPITGRRADLAIIDDPIKSHAEADSVTFRDNVWNWYRADLATRLRPQGRVVLIMTRWHEDDLGGRLLAQDGSEWRIIRLPAFAENDDPLGRRPGAPLWPDWEDAAALARKRQTVGTRVWSALFQQKPAPPGGSLFRVASIRVIDHVEADERPPVRAWDLASTVDNGHNDPDWTVGVKLQRDAYGMFTVMDVVRLRGSPLAVGELVARTAEMDGRHVVIGLPLDPGAAGKFAVSHITARLAGYRVLTSREAGSKITRAGPVASQVEAGNLALLRGSWNRIFVDELSDFPYGRKDDQVDALSRAFAMLTEVRTPTRRLEVPVIPR